MAAALAGCLLVAFDAVIIAIKSRSTDFCACTVFCTNTHCTPDNDIVVDRDLGTFADGYALVNEVGNDIVFDQYVTAAFTDINGIGPRANPTIHPVAANNPLFNIVGIDTIDLVIRVRAVNIAVFHVDRAFLELEHIDISVTLIVFIFYKAVFKRGRRLEAGGHLTDVSE